MSKTHNMASSYNLFVAKHRHTDLFLFVFSSLSRNGFASLLGLVVNSVGSGNRAWEIALPFFLCDSAACEDCPAQQLRVSGSIPRESNVDLLSLLLYICCDSPLKKTRYFQAKRLLAFLPHVCLFIFNYGKIQIAWNLSSTLLFSSLFHLQEYLNPCCNFVIHHFLWPNNVFLICSHNILFRPSSAEEHLAHVFYLLPIVNNTEQGCEKCHCDLNSNLLNTFT